VLGEDGILGKAEMGGVIILEHGCIVTDFGD
jgi:hypothetical protein